MMIERKLYKIILSAAPLTHLVAEKREAARQLMHVSEEELDYFVFTGTTSTDTYNANDERIAIAMKDGTIRDISEVEDPLLNQALARPVHKNYICYIVP